MKTRSLVAGAALALAALASPVAQAQEVTLKVHFFLPPTSFANTLFITPWCERIAQQSNQRMKCQIFPTMQLGGTPPQLDDQVRDGVFHMTSKPVKSLADLRGLKLRAPTRLTNKFIAMLGATPVSMPVPQVSDALSKGVIDGAVVPYEVVPAVKIQELVKYHSETDPAEPAFYTSTFIFAMNKAKYDALPADLKKVIDANAGQALSGQVGKAFLQADTEGKKLTTKNTTNVIPAAELGAWKTVGNKLASDWVNEMNGKGLPGAKLLEDAKALIARHVATTR